MDDFIADICERIEPTRSYTVAELIERLGLSRSAIYRYIDKACFGSRITRIRINGRWTTVIQGKQAIAFCEKYPDLLHLYSTYGGRKRAARVSPGHSRAVKKVPRRWQGAFANYRDYKRWLKWEVARTRGETAERKALQFEEYSFDVARACRRLHERGKKVTVRKVQAIVGGRTQIICSLVREFKRDLARDGVA